MIDRWWLCSCPVVAGPPTPTQCVHSLTSLLPSLLTQPPPKKKTGREIVSPATAKELIFTSRRFSGQEARELGVVNEAVGDAWHEAWSLAERIAANGPLGVRGAKEVIDGCHNLSFNAAVSLSSRLRGPLSETDDFKEALQAFEEKRKPVFKGR